MQFEAPWSGTRTGLRRALDRTQENPLVIAEVGSVHDGSYGNALRLIELAKVCGADFVKFQTHLAEYESTLNAPSPSFFSAEKRYEYFQRTSFTPREWRGLFEEAKKIGIGFMSSVFSGEALRLLLDTGVQHIKLPSGEITNVSLLEEIAQSNPVTYISTGMSNWSEIDTAVELLAGVSDLTLMQCTSEYPTNTKDAGVNIVSEMRSRYPHRVGFTMCCMLEISQSKQSPTDQDQAHRPTTCRQLCSKTLSRKFSIDG